MPVRLDSHVASLRRHAACALQNPSGKSTDQMTTSLYVENIGLVALERMLDSKYWNRYDVSLASKSAARNEQRVDFRTSSSKALNQLFCAQDTRHLGQDAAKLICPKGHREATLMVFASPPGEIRFRRRADSTEVVEGSFNLSTLNQVRTGLVVMPHRSSTSVSRPCTNMLGQGLRVMCACDSMGRSRYARHMMPRGGK